MKRTWQVQVGFLCLHVYGSGRTSPQTRILGAMNKYRGGHGSQGSGTCSIPGHSRIALNIANIKKNRKLGGNQKHHDGNVESFGVLETFSKAFINGEQHFTSKFTAATGGIQDLAFQTFWPSKVIPVLPISSLSPEPCAPKRIPPIEQHILLYRIQRVHKFVTQLPRPKVRIQICSCINIVPSTWMAPMLSSTGCHKQ